MDHFSSEAEFWDKVMVSKPCEWGRRDYFCSEFYSAVSENQDGSDFGILTAGLYGFY